MTEQDVARRLDVPMLGAVLLTVPALVIEQASDTHSEWAIVTLALNWVVWMAFVVEASLMLWAVDDRWRWAKEHPFDLAIIFLTPPFLPFGLQGARLFRLLRVLRLVKAATLARRVLNAEGVKNAAIIGALAVVAGGAAFSVAEKAQGLSVWDGIWWAITTATTVGYGDISPHTTAGRIIAIIVMAVGIGFVGLVIGAIAEHVVREQKQSERERQELRERLEEVLARLDAGT